MTFRNVALVHVVWHWWHQALFFWLLVWMRFENLHFCAFFKPSYPTASGELVFSWYFTYFMVEPFSLSSLLGYLSLHCKCGLLVLCECVHRALTPMWKGTAGRRQGSGWLQVLGNAEGIGPRAKDRECQRHGEHLLLEQVWGLACPIWFSFYMPMSNHWRVLP